MKDLLRSVAMAFQMFSVFPMPNVEWKKENMKYMLCALPLVGAVIALALRLWLLLRRRPPHHSLFEGDDAEQPAAQGTDCCSGTRPSLKLKIRLNVSKASENPAVKSGKLK